MLIASLSTPITFGTDATGVEITTDAIAVKWVSLDFTTQQATCECTLPDRLDVCFATQITFDPADTTSTTLTAALAAAVEETVPSAQVSP